jgi:hypothetical protein
MKSVLRLLVILLTVAVLSTSSVSAQSIDGNWTLDLSASEGEHSFDLTLAVDGETLTGTSGDEIFEGTLKDGVIELSGEHYIGEAGFVAVLSITGTFDADAIKGTGSWDAYVVDVSGRRRPSK